MGEPLRFTLDAGQYGAQVRFTKPPRQRKVDSEEGSDGRLGRSAAEPQQGTAGDAGATPQPTSAPDNRLNTVLVNAPVEENGKLAVALEDTDLSGVYEAAVKSNKGDKEELRHYAVNVDPSEGDLKMLWGPELAARLKNADCEFHQAASFRYAAEDHAGSNLSLLLLFALVALLVGEQLLAYSASYHPKSPAASVAAGGQSGHGLGHNRRLGRSAAEPQPTLTHVAGR